MTRTPSPETPVSGDELRSSFNAYGDVPIPVAPCACGYEWRAEALPEEVCHHTSGGREYIVICPRCRADGELKATPKWAVEAWNAKRAPTPSADVSSLMPCPFCGKAPLIVCPDNSYGSAMVTCGDANECPVDLTAWGDLESGETLADAIAAWNTRAAYHTEAAIVLKRYREALEQIERLEPETLWGTRDRYTGERPEEKALVESEVKDIARAALKAGA